ncbi:MAG: MMPL family transporter, partial [Pseudomonadota bacterium]
LLDAARTHPLSGGRLITQDRTLMAAVVALTPETLAVDRLAATRSEIVDALETSLSGTNVTVALSGLPELRLTVIASLLRDQFLLNALGVLAGLLVATIALRSFWLAVLTSLPPVFGMLWTLGFLGHSGLGVNLVTNSLPVLVLMLGFADSMHMTFDLRRRARRRGADRQAIEASLMHIGPACVITTITTGVAFAALLISDSELIRSLGIAGIAAVTVTLTAVLVLHPLAFTLLGQRWPIRQALAAHAMAQPTGRRTLLPVIEAVLRWPWRVTLAGLLLLISAVAAYTTIEPRYRFTENLPADTPVMLTLAEIESRLGPTGTIDLPVYDLFPSSTITPEGLTTLGAAHRAADAAAAGHTVLSLWSVATWLAPDDPPGAADSLNGLLTDMSDDMRQRLMSRDGTAALVRVLVPDEGIAVNRTLMERLATSVNSALASAGHASPPVVAASLLSLSATVGGDMLRQLSLSFTLAAALACGLMAVWCRSPRLGLIAILPNLLPIMLVGAWLSLSGQGLQFTSALALTIALGIAVDDTVHILNRLRRYGDRACAPRAVKSALLSVAPVLVLTTVILCAGITATQLSEMPMVSYFGVLTMVILCLALIADVIVLPACLVTLGPILKRWGLR